MTERVPPTAIAQLASGHLRVETQAIALFADISGFTLLTERLAEHGREGAELLAEALRFHFDPLVRAVNRAGGTITGFAGDAFTAVFPDTSDEALGRALDAALDMRAFFASNPLWRNRHGEFAFGLKLGLCVDRVVAEVVQPEAGRAVWYHHGPGIDRCAQAEHRARAGDLVVAPEVLLRRPDLQVEPRADGHAAVVSAAPTAAERGDDAGSKPEASPADEGAFLPQAALDFARDGEFRDVTVVFLSFGPMRDLPGFVAGLVRSLDRLGEGLLRVEFGDKGGVAWTFFGMPIARGDDTDRALAFVADVMAARDPRIDLRAGVSRGVAYAGLLGGIARAELTCLGRPVNLAARLMGIAPWGEAWVSESVAARSRSFRFQPRGEHALKGFGTPVAAFAMATRIARTSGAGTGLLVGRARELAALEAFVAPVLDGRYAGFCNVDGEAGMGKSHLVAALHARLVERTPSLLWLHAPCDATLRESTSPFAHALRRWAGVTEAVDEAAIRAGLDVTLATLLARLPSGAPERSALDRARPFLAALLGLRAADSLYERLDPRLRHTNTLASIRTWLAAEARTRPVILLVEDGMWIDEDSVSVLQSLSRDPFAVAILITSRPRDDGTPHRLEVDAAHAVQVAELDATGLRELAESHLGARIAPPLVDLLARTSGGNPFFAEQILAWLDERQALAEGPDGIGPSRGDVSVPDDVGALLVARLDRLATGVKRTVQAAAVLGREVEVRALSRMLSDSSVDADLAEAGRVQVLSDLGEMRMLFRHALLRDAAYEMQARARLRVLHRAAGDALEIVHAAELDTHLGEIAHHFDRAEVADRAIDYLRRASEYELRVYHNRQAAAHLDRLVTWLPERGPERRAAETSRAKVLRVLSRWAEGLEACRRGQAAEDTPDLRLLSQEAFLNSVLGNHAEARRVADQCIAFAASTGSDEDLGRAEGALGFAVWQAGDLAAARRSFARSAAACLAAGDAAGDATASNNLAYVVFVSDGAAAAVPLLERALAAQRTAGDRASVALGLNNLGFLFWTLGEGPRGMPLLEESVALGRELGDVQVEARALGNLGLPWFDAGDGARALSCLDEAIRLWRSIGEKNPFFHIMRADVLRRLGDSGADTALAEARAQSRAYDHPEHVARLGLVEGHFLRDAGDDASARARYQATIDLAEASGVHAVARQVRRALAALDTGAAIPGLAPGE